MIWVMGNKYCGIWDFIILYMFFGPIEYIAIKYRMYGEDFDIDETVNDIVNTIFRAYSKKKDFKK